MQRKIVFINTALNNKFEKEFPGISKKIRAQVKELNRAGLATDLKMVYYLPKFIRFLPFQSSSVPWKKLDICEKYDGLYLRYGSSDYQMIKWLKSIKRDNPRFKVVIEIPTYPYEHELMNNRHRIIIRREKKYREQLKGIVDRFVINSDYQKVFGVPTIITNNGVDMELVQKRVPISSNENVINICFVAVFAMWHGADRLLSGFRNYYRNGGKRDIIIHMVGDGETEMMASLRNAAADDLIKERVKFYGFIDKEELAQVYNMSQLAVASLGLHRLHIDAPSTLKTREYLARGIPFIYSSNIVEFRENPVDFALQISADENPVDFDDVLSFYDKLMDENDVVELTDRIRAYAEKYVSIQKSMKPIVEYFMS